MRQKTRTVTVPKATRERILRACWGARGKFAQRCLPHIPRLQVYAALRGEAVSPATADAVRKAESAIS
jgi:hypothetical protein